MMEIDIWTKQERDHMVYLDMDGRETLKWALHRVLI